MKGLNLLSTSIDEGKETQLNGIDKSIEGNFQKLRKDLKDTRNTYKYKKDTEY